VTAIFKETEGREKGKQQLKHRMDKMKWREYRN
jgi:hypothetical protein